MVDPKILTYPGRRISRDQLVSALNYLHFRHESLLVILRHKEYDYQLSLKAAPRMPQNNRLEGEWLREGNFPRNIHRFNLDKIIVPGPNALVFCPPIYYWDGETFSADLPEEVEPFHGRQALRNPCRVERIEATILQNSIGFCGHLLDFAPNGFRININARNPQNFYWLNANEPVTLSLKHPGAEDVLFCGEARIHRTTQGEDQREVVLLPAVTQAARYRPRKARTKRLTMRPAPTINFRHPFTGQTHNLKITDLATLGISVEEPPDRSCLVAGLLLPEVELSLADSPFLKFSGQVVYRQETNGRVRSGITILDIDVEDHYKLIGLVHQVEDERAYVSPHGDPEEFMRFFFDSGFLYPSKYAEIARDKERFLEACRKLYAGSKGIARSFVYREDGLMTGHISALRIYRHTWLNHHHAAFSSRRAGLKVLRQISDFINDSYYLNPIQLRYVAAIWRPNNSFPAKFFGRFAEGLADPQKCSMDTFAYLRGSVVDQCQDWGPLSGPPWELAKAQQSDLYEFEGFYRQVSGGLLPQAFDLTPESFDDQSISEAYKASGLKRERHLHALRHGMDLVALIEVQDSDTGLNMSELTNAVTIFVLNQEVFSPKILHMLQCIISVKYCKEQHPVLLYPRDYAVKHRLEYEKDYTVWILNLDHSDAYMENLNGYVNRRANG
jgi:hypothetical protein